MSAEKKPLAILVVEDNDDDFEVTFRALKQGMKLPNEIYRCLDGAEAIAFLRREDPYTDTLKAPTPRLVLVDVNLPRVSGREVLKLIKSDDRLKEIPVVMLTASDDEKDIALCYHLGANTYVKKASDMQAFFDDIKTLNTYWFEISILPG